MFQIFPIIPVYRTEFDKIRSKKGFVKELGHLNNHIEDLQHRGSLTHCGVSGWTRTGRMARGFLDIHKIILCLSLILVDCILTLCLLKQNEFKFVI